MIPGFRIIRELGRGGMATVYLAEQESLGREVALKVLAPSLAADASFAERFVREARITGAFRHRHLLSVFDAGRAGDHLYLAMEYVPGGSAASLRGADQELIRRCLIDIAGALGYAHARGVVHRDIKPENILRREDDSFLLSDFGIARSTKATRALTAPESAIGTPAYMSPEQWRGAEIDGRADLYSLGIVAYELLTGALPFSGADGWSIGLQHMNAARPILPPSLAEWQPLIDQLLAVDPQARMADAQTLVLALGGDSAGTPFTPLPQSAATPTTPLPLASATPLPIATGSNSRLNRGLPALALLALLAVVLWWWLPPTEVSTGTTNQASDSVAAVAGGGVERSIAVLPFRALSTESDDAFFADGLTEEILASLASVPELRVTGRRSSFAWKDKDADLREIAQALGVAYLLEGSIRRAGNQLRISAALIAASDGATRWSQTFERELKDAFAIQNEIALAVADQLSVSIGARSPPTLVRLPEADRARYLEAIGRISNYRPADLALARETLQDLIATRSVGADAYSRLVNVLAAQMRLREVPFAEGIALQQQLSAQLSERFPDSIESLLVSAMLVQSRGNHDHRLAHYRQALHLFEVVMQRAPNEPIAAIGAAHGARVLQDYDRAIRYADRAIAIDPNDPTTHFAKLVAMAQSGRVEQALAGLVQLADSHPLSAATGELPVWLILSGRLAEAAQRLEGCDSLRFDPGRCRYLRHYILFSLGFKIAAEEELRLWREAVPADAAITALIQAIYAGRVPMPPAGPTNSVYEWLSAYEALALGDQASFLAWIEAAGVRDWLNERDDPIEFESYTYGIGTLAAQSALLRAEQPRLLADRFAATARALAALPDQYLPFESAVAVTAAVLSGDLDAAFSRLQAIDAVAPFAWADVVISPSGRDLPIATALRADPRFEPLWTRRANLIERERRELKEQWPGVK